MMTHLSDDTFETLLARIASSGVLDIRHIRFIDPYGMIGILEAGIRFSAPGKDRTLLLPESEDVLRYLERMDFFRYAGRYFVLQPDQPDLQEGYLRSSCSDVLLEITPVEKSDDIHFIIRKVRNRAHTILARQLHYDERAINGFITSLSEVCQNIIEHSGNTGFVGIQKYRFQKLRKNVVKIAVMDLGIGFRKSLSERVRLGSDVEAIGQALFYGVSRFREQGRGHGLAGVRRFVSQWNGKLMIRSGTAKVSIIPEWGWGRDRETQLPYFPGAQINIMLPEV